MRKLTAAQKVAMLRAAILQIQEGLAIYHTATRKFMGNGTLLYDPKRTYIGQVVRMEQIAAWALKQTSPKKKRAKSPRGAR